MSDNTKTDRFHVSVDELASRMQKKAKYNEQLQGAVLVLESAIERVIKKLGVDTEKDDESIKIQMDLLGILLNELPGYPGMFVTTMKGDEKTPYAWISDAMLDSEGKYHYEIHWLKDERLSDVKGTEAIQ